MQSVITLLKFRDDVETMNGKRVSKEWQVFVLVTVCETLPNIKSSSTITFERMPLACGVLHIFLKSEDPKDQLNGYEGKS